MNKTLLTVAFLLGFMNFVYADLIPQDDGLVYDTDLQITWYVPSPSNAVGGSWAESLVWADQLEYGGYSDWRLPSSVNADGSISNGAYNTIESEMGHLYYTELGNKEMWMPDGSPRPDGGLKNIGPFDGFQDTNNTYWSSTDIDFIDVYGRGYAIAFGFEGGFQGARTKDSGYKFMAVRDVNVAPVPEPSTMLLLSAGLVGLVGFRRFRK